MVSVSTCRGPMNEDVFSAPAFTEEKTIDSDIQEITEQIHRLLLQVKSPYFEDTKTHAHFSLTSSILQAIMLSMNICMDDVKVVHF